MCHAVLSIAFMVCVLSHWIYNKTCRRLQREKLGHLQRSELLLKALQQSTLKVFKGKVWVSFRHLDLIMITYPPSLIADVTLQQHEQLLTEATVITKVLLTCWPLILFFMEQISLSWKASFISLMSSCVTSLNKRTHQINCIPLISDRKWAKTRRQLDQTEKEREGGRERWCVIDLNSFHLSKSMLWPVFSTLFDP